MTDEEIIGKEFEGVYFERVKSLPFSDIYHKPMLGKTGIVVSINTAYPHLCLVKFDEGIGAKSEVHFPVVVVKQQIEDRIPIDLDKLFNEIKSL
jgi:hypothetical protein